jgi:transcriptional regulator with XRE-family HTH domain
MNDYNLKEEIKSLGMTQKEFAEYVGVSVDAVSKWVRGEVRVPKWVTILIPLLHKEKAYEQAKAFFCK